jgi:NitT/TauT family transport system ATP-binding protein
MTFHCREITHVFPSTPGDVVALQTLNLDVHAGEFVCIVGPSGCGKSTLLKIIAGLLSPTRGQLVFEAGSKKARRTMVFQDQGLYPWMTVVDNVAFGLEVRGVPAAQRRTEATEFLNRVGLRDFIGSYPHELSGGMRQRVAILRAFMTDPDVLLMDEPLAALDAQTRLVMQEELLRIWREHRKTVVYVTHDIDEAIHLADRVLVMSGRPGSIRAEIDIPVKRSPIQVDHLHPELLQVRDGIWAMIKDEVRHDLGIA